MELLMTGTQATLLSLFRERMHVSAPCSFRALPLRAHFPREHLPEMLCLYAPSRQSNVTSIRGETVKWQR